METDKTVFLLGGYAMTIRECMEAARETAKQLTPENGGPAWDEVIADTVDVWSNY